MTNIFTARILRRFAKQVPELEISLKSAKMSLKPTSTPPFEMLIRSIVFQQLAYKAARTIHDRLLDLVGTLTPTKVLKKTQDKLRSVGLSRQKASYVHNVAEAFQRGGFLYKYRETTSLDDLSSGEITELFSSIKGVGDWTVQMYLIFSLGRLDVLAAKDLGVRKGVQKLYGLAEVPTPKQVEVIADKWHPLETVGTYLAWRILESE